MRRPAQVLALALLATTGCPKDKDKAPEPAAATAEARFPATKAVPHKYGYEETIATHVDDATPFNALTRVKVEVQDTDGLTVNGQRVEYLEDHSSGDDGKPVPGPVEKRTFALTRFDGGIEVVAADGPVDEAVRQRLETDWALVGLPDPMQLALRGAVVKKGDDLPAVGKAVAVLMDSGISGASTTASAKVREVKADTVVFDLDAVTIDSVSDSVSTCTGTLVVRRADAAWLSIELKGTMKSRQSAELPRTVTFGWTRRFAD